MVEYLLESESSLVVSNTIVEYQTIQYHPLHSSNIKMRALSFTSTSLLIVLTLAVARGEGGGGEAGAQYEEDEEDYYEEEMPYDNMYDNAEDYEMPMTMKFANEFPDKVRFWRTRRRRRGPGKSVV